MSGAVVLEAERTMAVFERESDQLIGFCGLEREEPVGWILGYLLAKLGFDRVRAAPEHGARSLYTVGRRAAP